MIKPIKFVLGEDAIDRISDIELLAMAKGWTKLKKMACMRMTHRVYVEPSLKMKITR